ncbi:helix-turn-helix domain-containing protein [Pelagibaculum spongiae]|uniref:HTH cro/C1-type domain-containing protein n=1 Tax=Pelagibaculum spongiae TaxID=2080658 RepID=A0A2V1GP64_9GAMM|nr:helix-turn-helix transcriptional regulator [Pelagibaculum spongiae]PVZ64494.1 hypothetical protein DC094_19465 [Pelagibaculum spongiae]
MTTNKLAEIPTGLLLEALKDRIENQQRQLATSDKLANAVPIEEAAKLISGRRNQLGMSQQDVSDITGVSCTTISKAENSSMKVQLDNFIAIAKATGLKVWVA